MSSQVGAPWIRVARGPLTPRAYPLGPCLVHTHSHWSTNAFFVPSDTYDLDKLVDPQEVARVTCVQRQLGGASSCRDKEVDRSSPTRLPSGTDDGRVDPAVSSRGIAIERKRVERGLGTLEAILPSAALVRIARGVWSGSQFCHRDGTHGNF